MIDINVIEKTLLERLDALENKHCLEIRTYKRNRSVLFVKVSGDSFLVKEDGYRSESCTVDRGKLKKVIKTVLKREFPRSRKVRLYDLGKYNPDVHESMGRKKI